MKSLHEFDRKVHEAYKQHKAGMISTSQMYNRITSLILEAMRTIKEWQCPACLNVMGELHEGDAIAELWCEGCGQGWNRKYLLKLNAEARRAIREGHLAVSGHYQARRKGNSISMAERVSNVQAKQVKKGQKTMEKFFK
jgi:hypothetical protein